MRPMPVPLSIPGVVVLLGMTCAAGAQAAGSAPVPGAPPEPGAIPVLPTIDVAAATPLPGTGIDVDRIPASVTFITRDEITRTRSPDVVRTLQEQTPSITLTESSGNSFQPDVVFRGFEASPVAGTPQGLAVYQNDVRVNEAFGDTLNWDFIPTVAIRDMSVVSNN